jgi:electron transfer flavoprotein alpha subunit
MSSILTFSEEEELGLELVTAGIGVSASIGTPVIASSFPAIGHSEDVLSRSGASEVLRISLRGISRMTPEVIAQSLYRAAVQKEARLILIGSTKDGKEVAGRLAALLKASVATDCNEISYEDGGLVVQRVAFGGRIVSWGSLLSDRAVVALRPRSYRKSDAKQPAPVSEISLDLEPPKVQVTGVNQKPPSVLDLSKADKIVSIGRGLRRREDLSLVQQLADALGASVGCSRPISADLGWLPEEAHIGLTGVQVKPKLYLAVGISGQLQHLAGIKDSGVIIAINSDKSAPIFKNCDYGAVGDLYQVLPALTEAIRKKRHEYSESFKE